MLFSFAWNYLLEACRDADYELRMLEMLLVRIVFTLPDFSLRIKCNFSMDVGKEQLEDSLRLGKEPQKLPGSCDCSLPSEDASECLCDFCQKMRFVNVNRSDATNPVQVGQRISSGINTCPNISTIAP